MKTLLVTKHTQMIDPVATGKRLEEFRKRNRYSQRGLAKLLDISNTMVSKIEAGEVPISDAIAKKIKDLKG